MATRQKNGNKKYMYIYILEDNQLQWLARRKANPEELAHLNIKCWVLLSQNTNLDNKNERKVKEWTRDAVGRSTKFKGTFSIISGMNFCPPNPGSTVITRTISTGFSPSICGLRKNIIFILESSAEVLCCYSIVQTVGPSW